MPDIAPQQLNPWWYQLINRAYRLGDQLGIIGPLQVDQLLHKASQSQGRIFDNCSFMPALEALIDSANTEAHLNGFGRVMLTALVGRYLKQRLQLEQWREDHPEVSREKIVRPVIIAGLPRTGTTFLHQLLSQDEQFRAPRTFEIDRPVPPPAEDAIHRDRRVRDIQRGIDVIHRIVPHFKAIHTLGAVLPEECQQITAYQFSSIAYQHILEVPSFRRWVLGHDFTEDLLFHRQFLQHLQSGWQRQHWLLKSPAHIQYLPTLLKVYPDAMIIHTHRNPEQVMASTTSLSWTMQSVFSDHIDKKTCASGQLEFFRETLKICLADREELGESDAIFDLNYSSFIDAPMAMVEAIYVGFGLVLTQATRDKMQVFLADNQQHRYGGHKYTADEFGLDDMERIPEFIQYRQRFSL
jgi:hypothetical protein